MTPAFSICVYCGSRPGERPEFTAVAEAVGRWIGERRGQLVYGGGRTGLMGTVAEATRAAGGRVVGIIPKALVDRELANTLCDELHVVDTMHERKALMGERADAFIALPGGAGTLEEIAEQWTWAQLTIHTKPSGFLDVKGFWAPMRQMLESMVVSGFVRAEQSGIVSFSDDLDTLLAALAAPPSWTDKWGAARVETPKP